MCIVIGKYFEDYGWTAIKNRDRNYTPSISFKNAIRGNNEIMYFWDDVTQYCEGINSHGIGVLSASLMVLDDEKEYKKSSNKPSKDGLRIKKALELSNIVDVIKFLIEAKLTGHTLIFNEDRMFCLEGAWVPGGYKNKQFDYKLNEIDKKSTIVRTNHGIDLTWAGYQRGDNIEKTKSRISSESRMLIANKISEKSTCPFEILDKLNKNYTDNGQLNPTRTGDENSMRTTSQIIITPKTRSMYVKPLASKCNTDSIPSNSKITVKII